MDGKLTVEYNISPVPTEILAAIMKYIPEFMDIKTVRLVCRSWKDAIEFITTEINFPQTMSKINSEFVVNFPRLIRCPLDIIVTRDDDYIKIAKFPKINMSTNNSYSIHNCIDYWDEYGMSNNKQHLIKIKSQKGLLTHVVKIEHGVLKILKDESNIHKRINNLILRYNFKVSCAWNSLETIINTYSEITHMILYNYQVGQHLLDILLCSSNKLTNVSIKREEYKSFVENGKKFPAIYVNDHRRSLKPICMDIPIQDTELINLLRLFPNLTRVVVFSIKNTGPIHAALPGLTIHRYNVVTDTLSC